MSNRPKTWLIMAAALSLGISHFEGSFNPYYFDIIISIGINILLAVGLNLVNGYTGQFSLGHAGFMAVGAYLSASLTVFYGDELIGITGGEAIPFLTALIIGGLGAAVTGLAVGVPSLRLKGDYLAIVTLGFGEIIRVILQNTEIVGGPRGFSVPNRPDHFFFWTFAAAAIAVYVVVSLVHSTYGRGFLTVRDDEIAAEAMGINTTKYKVIAFVVGAFFAGIAGGFYAHFKQFITPEGFNFLRSVDVVVIVILGGMGNTPGVIAAAVLLTILPEGLRGLSKWDALPESLAQIVSNRMILYSLLLIILMLTRPQGLFAGGGGKAKKWLTKRPRPLP
jgi:branched-chain amino acid transport system permease protein